MDLSLKERIVQVLLVSPKSTGEIAKKLGYIDKKGNGRYNVVSPYLKELEASGLLRSEKIERKSHGPPPTIYNIVYEFPALQKLIENHPKLLQDLQSNDMILSMLVKKHSWIYKSDKDLNEEHSDTPKEELKVKLKLSEDFFKICLANEPENLRKIFDDIYGSTDESLLDDEFELEQKGQTTHPPPFNRYYKCTEIIFTSCFYHDILTGHEKTKAVEYVKKRFKERY